MWFADGNGVAAVPNRANALLLPASTVAGFTAEVWICPEGNNSSSRVAFASGRFELGLDSGGAWTFTVYKLLPELPVAGKMCAMIITPLICWLVDE